MRILHQILDEAPDQFSHCGDLGDTIYGLPVLRQHWLATGRKATLCLYPETPRGTHLTPQHAYLPENVGNIAPLIEAQDYIEEVIWCTWADSRLPEWRNHLNEPNLVACHFAPYPELAVCTDPWLRVTPGEDSGYVALWRTSRWRGNLDYRRYLQGSSRRHVFLGTTEEHKAFCESFGVVVHHVQTATLMEAAVIIAGAEYCIGNQTSLLAVATGLGKRVIRERPSSPDQDNCHINEKTTYPFPPYESTTPKPQEGIRSDCGHNNLDAWPSAELLSLLAAQTQEMGGTAVDGMGMVALVPHEIIRGDMHPELSGSEHFHQGGWGGGAMTIEEAQLLFALVQITKPRLILETGTETGFSTAYLARGCASNGFGRVVTVETEGELVATAQKRLGGLAQFVEFIHGDAQGVIASDRRYDFALLDTVIWERSAELKALLPKLNAGAIVAVHDTSPNHPGRKECNLLGELAECGLQVVHFASPRGLTILQAPR